MMIELNGEPMQLGDDASVAQAVAAVGAGDDRRGVAAAVDGEVVPRAQWESRKLTDGAAVEVVRAVQGG